MAPDQTLEDALLKDLYLRTNQAIREVLEQFRETGEPPEKHAIAEAVDARLPVGYPAIIAGGTRRRLIRDIANDIIATTYGGDAA